MTSVTDVMKTSFTSIQSLWPTLSERNWKSSSLFVESRKKSYQLIMSLVGPSAFFRTPFTFVSSTLFDTSSNEAIPGNINSYAGFKLFEDVRDENAFSVALNGGNTRRRKLMQHNVIINFKKVVVPFESFVILSQGYQ